jgi:hypothetical protein
VLFTPVTRQARRGNWPSTSKTFRLRRFPAGPKDSFVRSINRTLMAGELRRSTPATRFAARRGRSAGVPCKHTLDLQTASVYFFQHSAEVEETQVFAASRAPSGEESMWTHDASSPVRPLRSFVVSRARLSSSRIHWVTLLYTSLTRKIDRHLSALAIRHARKYLPPLPTVLLSAVGLKSPLIIDHSCAAIKAIAATQALPKAPDLLNNRTNMLPQR